MRGVEIPHLGYPSHAQGLAEPVPQAGSRVPGDGILQRFQFPTRNHLRYQTDDWHKLVTQRLEVAMRNLPPNVWLLCIFSDLYFME